MGTPGGGWRQRSALGLLLEVVGCWEALGGADAGHWEALGCCAQRCIGAVAGRCAMLEHDTGWCWCGTLGGTGQCWSVTLGGAGAGRWEALGSTGAEHWVVLVQGTGSTGQYWRRAVGAATKGCGHAPSGCPHFRREGVATPGGFLLVASAANPRRRAGDSKREARARGGMNGAGRRGAPAGKLSAALRGGSEAAVEALLQHAADPNLLLPEGFAPIHLGAAGGPGGGVRCLRLLLRYGGDPNARAAEGLTPLHVAASWGSCGCLELLLQNGGDPELRDQDGKRAVDLALEQGHGLCVQLLRDWAQTEASQGPRHSLSILSEDYTDVGLLSSTRMSQLEEPGLGGSCRSGEPLCRAQPPSGPSVAPWIPEDPALPPQPLASSTLLCAGGEHEEVPPRGRGLCSSLQPRVGAGSPPQPLRCSRNRGVLEAGTRGHDHCGDSSGDSECFVTAMETLDPSGAGGCPGEAPSSAGPWELPPQNPSAAEELPALLWGCSLERSPPRTLEFPCSPAGTAAGDVTSQELQPPQFCHVTPRTKSRLQASAARLGASSSSSSLFDASLEKPRRPPRVRAPRGVPKDPATTPGDRITLSGEDVSRVNRERTASSDDTQILPRTPSRPSSPQETSSSSPTVLLAPGDHGRAQNPLSDAQELLSPTVLLGPGGPSHPLDSPSDAQGSPSSTVLLRPGDSDNLQDSPPHAQGSPPATDPRVPEPGTPPTPRSPTGQSPHRPMGPDGWPPAEWHGPGAEATSPGDGDQVRSMRVLSDEALLRRLRALGYDPGPITVLTRRVYLRRLEELSRSPAGHSPELADALRTGHIPNCTEDEMALAQQFDRPDQNRHWREGLLKASFNYLLLDPRTTRDLPLRCHRLSPMECFRTFVDAVFYVGKGTRARPYSHLAEAVSQHRVGTRKGCPNVQRILEIWASGLGVISLHCFQSSVPAEAYTREGCLLEALGLRAVTNQRKGKCYGVAASWPPARRRRLGVHLLHRAMRIFLAEGERQLRPADIQAGR
ncbi:ankyrin repeat and LEM domain-containing protein 1 isoform X2 [Numida meleagris]|uniref:ankyrin repeat and LEM domain-containing protein 1 isoform X2 n=1 Tax=Numida meleagris TaxID=8996 RepID=UPI000B3D9269|nr:ankyrin repeat and LEM domain-containing protein 1 isoform X2 [Numida meleagris]